MLEYQKKSRDDSKIMVDVFGSQPKNMTIYASRSIQLYNDVNMSSSL